MEFIAHRVNNKEDLINLSNEYGVEIDLRDDLNGRIYMEHDPFKDGEGFEEYLKAYKHGTIILNVKSERIEHRVLDLIKKYNIKKYFFLDSTFPMIKLLSEDGEKNVAIRYSEFEGMDTVRVMSGKVDWIWVDCFTKLPINNEIYNEIKKLGYKLCLVSPELQGQSKKIKEYANQIKDEQIYFDAICTKEYNIEKWINLLQ
ncbi:hypothetical protein DVV91_14800 [Clostridium botulinum]|uniref:hypothetical protein n=1 Tax=Clostridium botulinum TaxID=1491 RepID=UPI001968521D|nr:hypothetical protein [Clostridium botulinum]MBN1075610.1 hypothetical protein [Clostridium botulinum]